MFVLFTLLKVALDERKTLTKISMRNLSQQFPQTSARFGPDEIRKPVKSIWQKAFCTYGLATQSVSECKSNVFCHFSNGYRTQMKSDIA